MVSPGDQVWVRILEIDESRRRISLSVKRAEPQNLPLRDLMPPELTGEAEPEAPEEVPDLDVSEEVFPEPPPAEAEADETPAEAEADRRDARGARRGRRGRRARRRDAGEAEEARARGSRAVLGGQRS